MTSTKRTVLSFLRGGSPNLNANRMSGGSKASEHDSTQYLGMEENAPEEKQRTSSIISNSVRFYAIFFQLFSIFMTVQCVSNDSKLLHIPKLYKFHCLFAGARVHD